MTFGYGLLRGLEPNPGIGPPLFIAAGIAAIGGAFFTTDVENSESTRSIIHGLFSTTVFVSLTFAALVLARRFKEDRIWERYRPYSLVTGALAGLLLLIRPLFEPWGLGLHQRMLLLILFVWVEVLAVRLFGLAKLPPRLAG
jgi:hypothetical protein